MSAARTARALYLDLEGAGEVFAYLHPARRLAAGAGAAVLMCPPFGWDETCSYRVRREWARLLASEGHETLRLDLPSCGDSAGNAGDPGRVDAWTASIVAAAAWLNTRDGGRAVAAIGIGLGGMLAVRAVSAGAPIDQVVLWATPARGRALVRELRAFAELDTTGLFAPAAGATTEPAAEAAPAAESAPAAEPEPATESERASDRAPAEDDLRAGGFRMSAETARALRELDLTTLPIGHGRLRRALLLERDGLPVDARLRTSLEASGTEVTQAPGAGYAEMTLPPNLALPPADVFRRSVEWLGESGRPAAALRVDGGHKASRRLASEHAAIELEVDGTRIRETPLIVEQPFGELFAILAEPVSGPVAPLGAVLLNAGAHRRIGQGRMWVLLARRWAARGVPTLRLDLEGIGDAGGDAARFSELGELYTPRLVDQVLGALDALDARGLGPAYVLSGLCSGAFWSFHAALTDERVAAALMLNPQTLFWDPTQHTARVLRAGLRGVRSGASWKKLVRREINTPGLLRHAARVPSTVARRAIARGKARRAGGDRLDHAFDRLQTTGKHAHFMFSGSEPLREEFELERRVERLGRWPNISIEFLPGHDHILRPFESQLAAHTALDRELQRALERLAVRDAIPATSDGAASA